MPTFQATICNRKGITLLEILIVLVLMALFVTFALPRFRSNLELNLKKQARMLSGSIRFLYNQAIMKGMTYRLHFDLDEQTYWVESSTERVTLQRDTGDRSHMREALKRDRPTFVKDTDLLKKPVKLDESIKFKDIKTEGKTFAISSGHAYIHFFPHGYVEESQIRLESKDGKIYSIIVNPLTGGAKVYDHDISQK